MKAFKIHFIFTLVSIITLASFTFLQNDNHAEFFTHKGTIKVDHGDLKEFKKAEDLMVRTTIPAEAFKYEKVSMRIERTLDTLDAGFFECSFLKQEFNTKFKNKKDTVLWVFHPIPPNNHIFSDFSYWNHADGGSWHTCNSKVFFKNLHHHHHVHHHTLILRFAIYGIPKTGEKEEVVNTVKKKVPVFGTPELLLKSEELVLTH